MAKERSKALVLSDAVANCDLPLDVLEGLTELEPDLLGDMIWIAFCRKSLKGESLKGDRAEEVLTRQS